MNPQRRSPSALRRGTLKRFVLRLCLFFVLVLVLWSFTATYYSQAIAGAARLALRAAEEPNAVQIAAEAGVIRVARPPGDGAAAFHLQFSRYVFFGLVPLLALLLATPASGLKQHLMRALVGLGAMFLFHVVYLSASVELTYHIVGLRQAGSGVSPLLDWGQVLLRVSWEAAPVLIWGGIVWPRRCPASVKGAVRESRHRPIHAGERR
jgi:hypothetical protein